VDILRGLLLHQLHTSGNFDQLLAPSKNLHFERSLRINDYEQKYACCGSKKGKRYIFNMKIVHHEHKNNLFDYQGTIFIINNIVTTLQKTVTHGRQNYRDPSYL
jgi:hypothetical protein